MSRTSFQNSPSRTSLNLDTHLPATKSGDLDHPLLLELNSLRTSLKKFQHVAHSSSMQLQGKVMELMLMSEEKERAKKESEILRQEVEVLRKAAPETPFPTGSAQALSELTLAHRRLSSKLDHVHERYKSTQRSLLGLETENSVSKKERDAGAVMVQEWRDRVVEAERGREEEKGRRVEVEEELRIVKLALKEYKDNVQAAAGKAPIEKPSIEGFDVVATDKALNGDASTEKGSTSPSPVKDSLQHLQSLPSTPSNILLGIQGLHRLAADFQTSLTTSQSRVAQLELEAEDLRSAKKVAEEALVEVQGKMAELEGRLEEIKAEDHGAGAVVERYMAFTQKTTQQLHSHMQTANNRLSQTISTLRSQLLSTQSLLSREESRTKQLRSAIDELAEGYERETFGRRREVALRMKCLEREERRSEEGKRWMERVRRERGRIGDSGGGVGMGMSPTRPPRRVGSFSSNSLGAIASQSGGIDYAQEEKLSLLWDLLESGVSLFKDGDETLTDAAIRDGEMTPTGDGADDPVFSTKGRNLDLDSSLGRVLLAQEMVKSLTEDLERESQRNVKLERERLQHLADGGFEREAPSHANVEDTTAPVTKAEEEEEEQLIDVGPPASDANALQTPKESGYFPSGSSERSLGTSTSFTSPSTDITPFFSPSVTPGGESAPPSITSNSTYSTPVKLPQTPLKVKQQVDVDSLLEQLNNGTSRYSTTQKALHDGAASLHHLQTIRKTLPSRLQPIIQILLDGISDVMEDIRVEVEIAIADDERAVKGHQTVLTINPDEKAIKAAGAFIKGDKARVKLGKFERRLGDIESDLVELKMAILDAQSRADQQGEDETDDLLDEEGAESPSQSLFDPFTKLDLRTVTVRLPTPIPSNTTRIDNPLANPLLSHNAPGADRTMLGNGLKRGFFPALGRTFSGAGAGANAAGGMGLQRQSSFLNMGRVGSPSGGSGSEEKQVENGEEQKKDGGAKEEDVDADADTVRLNDSDVE